MEKILTFTLLCFLGAACATVGSGGCAHKQAPPPLPDLPSVEQGFQITNGVTLVFDGPVNAELSSRLIAAGAELHLTNWTAGSSFVFLSVDTQAKREAINAALLAGAVMRRQP